MPEPAGKKSRSVRFGVVTYAESSSDDEEVPGGGGGRGGKRGAKGGKRRRLAAKDDAGGWPGCVVLLPARIMSNARSHLLES